MVKMINKLAERRKFLRLEEPINITYTVSESSKTYNTATKDLSVDGLRFETRDRAIAESSVIELRLDIPGAANPIHAEGKIVWKKKLSLEDSASFDVGLEFTKIEEDNKNTFLKCLCDSIYKLSSGEQK